MRINAQAEHRTDLDFPKEKTAASRWAGVSAADGLYLLVIIAAAIMRLSDLGKIPLSPTEASEAFAAWQYLQPGSTAVLIGSPAYFTLTTLLMPVLGISDTIMRLVPALFGLGLICLPWLLRRRLGTTGVLVAAALLTASPLNSAISRTVGGDAIALFALLLVVVAAAQLNGDLTKKWFYTLTAAVGLGLTSSPLFYGGLLVFALALLAANLSPDRPFRSVLPERNTIIKGLILGLLVLLGLSTRLLTYPAGLDSSAKLVGDWLGQFGFSGGLQAIAAPFWVLVRYEIALIMLGTIAVAWAFWKNKSPGMLLLLWFSFSLALIFLQSSALSNVLLATLSGYLLVGLFSTHLLQQGMNRWTWFLTGGLLLISAILLVNVTRYLRVSIYDRLDLSNLWLGLLALAGAALLIYYFWAITDASITQGLWVAALLFLLAYEWGTAWQLTHFAANDPREEWVTTGTDSELPLLLDTLQEISRAASNSDADLTLLSAVDSPVLHWYLRDFWQATMGQTVPPQARQQVIISKFGEAEPLLGADYVGSDFGLLQSEPTAASESYTPLADMLRWWFFHETAVQPIAERVILWVRADLVLPQE
ncbi:MAG: glycosyltransferase family 39 protein [Candidatus Promineifilaceae bacterium]